MNAPIAIAAPAKVAQSALKPAQFTKRPGQLYGPMLSAKKLREAALKGAALVGMTEIEAFGFTGADSRRVQVVTAFGTLNGQRAKVVCGSKGGDFWRVEIKTERYGWVSILEPIRTMEPFPELGDPFAA